MILPFGIKSQNEFVSRKTLSLSLLDRKSIVIFYAQQKHNIPQVATFAPDV
jgi:hypothetical protein